ncbi:MAG: flagellar basal body rod protein FlgF [Halioglobus sp.]
MDHFVYIAASGARESMISQAANAQNMANASTSGFRADLMLEKVAQISGQGVGSRAYPQMVNSGVDVSEGVINITGRDLDVAINGPGWMTVQAADGSQGISRRGDLRVSELGQLVDGAGMQLVGEGGPIALPPFSNIAIGADGTISIVPLGEDPNTLAVVDRIKLVNPDPQNLEKGREGLLKTRDGEPLVADANVRMTSGSLESSNVDTVGSMVHMIELARQFENHVKMMKTAENLDQASAALMELS